MNIGITSKNQTKVNAVRDVFPEAMLKEINVSSGVSEQPFSDDETRKGAINRALNAHNLYENHICIGLEGGVMDIEGELYLCNWGALVSLKKEIFTASGARIKLPNKIKQELNEGIELGDVMEAYTKRRNVRVKEGAIGVFTNELVSRKELFIHVVKLLRGQWEFRYQ